MISPVLIFYPSHSKNSAQKNYLSIFMIVNNYKRPTLIAIYTFCLIHPSYPLLNKFVLGIDLKAVRRESYHSVIGNGPM
jgi:hypothetical protein